MWTEGGGQVRSSSPGTVSSSDQEEVLCGEMWLCIHDNTTRRVSSVPDSRVTVSGRKNVENLHVLGLSALMSDCEDSVLMSLIQEDDLNLIQNRQMFNFQYNLYKVKM